MGFVEPFRPEKVVYYPVVGCYQPGLQSAKTLHHIISPLSVLF